MDVHDGRSSCQIPELGDSRRSETEGEAGEFRKQAEGLLTKGVCQEKKQTKRGESTQEEGKKKKTFKIWSRSGSKQ